MRRSILFATVLVAAALLAPVVSAQPDNSTATPTAENATSVPSSTPTATPYPRASSADVNVSVDLPGFPGVTSADDCTERVGPLVDLCAAERVDRGTVAVVLVHETGGSVTLTDSFREGDIPRETFRVGRQPTRLEFSIVPDKDAAGVSIDTGRNLYGKHIVAPGGGFLPRPTKPDVLTVGVTIALLAPLMLVGTWFVLKRWQGGVRHVA